jgi:GNAT superfamily N-acetyltransferase
MKRVELRIHIRRAGHNDAATIANILHDSFAEYQASYTAEAFAATTPTSDQIRKRISEGPVWVALLDGEIVGTVGAVARSSGLYIRGMGVLPRARGHRIGELLLKEIEDYARDEGHNRLYLSTTPFLDRAIRLYEQFGFRRIEEGPHDLFGTPLLTMEKWLRASGQ